MTENIFAGYHAGKCIMQELEWQNLKCDNCGAEMPKYPKYDNRGNEIKTCKECGWKTILVRSL